MQKYCSPRTSRIGVRIASAIPVWTATLPNATPELANTTAPNGGIGGIAGIAGISGIAGI